MLGLEVELVVVEQSDGYSAKIDVQLQLSNDVQLTKERQT